MSGTSGAAQVRRTTGEPAHRIDDAVDRLHLQVGDVGGAEQLAGADEHHRLAVELALSSGRMVIGCGVPPLSFAVPTSVASPSRGAEVVVDVEAPDVAEHVAAVDPQRRVVDLGVSTKSLIWARPLGVVASPTPVGILWMIWPVEALRT